jgi:multidrug efflux pump subunit AcrB
MKLIIPWTVVGVVALAVVGTIWERKGGYASDKWTGIFFLTGAIALVGLMVSFGIALYLGA